MEAAWQAPAPGVDRHNMPYAVRWARPDDAAALLRILDTVGAEGIYIANETSGRDERWQRALLEHLDPSLQLVSVATVDEMVVGSLEAIRGGFAKNRHTATFGMALLPPARGRGMGRGLVEYCEAWARAQGVRKMAISVFASNGPALGLYQRLGYAEEGRRRGQYVLQGASVDEVLLAKWF